MSYDNELYQRVILDHNRNPKNFGPLDPHTHECDGFNPLCGDKLTVYLNVTGAGVIERVSFDGSGCAISKASASLMTEALTGREVGVARTLFAQFHKMVLGEYDPDDDDSLLGKLAIFEGIREYPSRIKCASLSWHTMKSALDGADEVTTE